MIIIHLIMMLFIDIDWLRWVFHVWTQAYVFKKRPLKSKGRSVTYGTVIQGILNT
jgi:hypothetical protein